MKVSVILDQKASPTVATIAPTRTVADAVQILSSKRIGALVVSNDQTDIQGIVSERDIVQQLGQDGSGVMSQPVSTIMTSPVETCFPAETALDVLARMTDGRFRHMPVADAEGRMIGILSIGDVVKARLQEIEAENTAMADMLSG